MGASLHAQLRNARLYELGHELKVGMAVNSAHPPFQLSLARRHGDIVRTDGVSTASELIIMGAHTGTHIDAIGHASINGVAYGGVRAQDIVGHEGLRDLGAELLPPIFAQAVLFDVPRYRNVAALDASETISAHELQEILQHAALSLPPGSCALIRTGWGAYWDDTTRYKGDATGLPGPDEEAAMWLAERDVMLVGSDTLSFEAVDPAANRRPVHGSLLVDRGIYIVEALDLEELARDEVYDFIFCALSLRIKGATGSPIRPVAIVPTG